MTETIATTTVGSSLSERLAALSGRLTSRPAIPAQRSADAFTAYAEVHKLGLDLAQSLGVRDENAA